MLPGGGRHGHDAGENEGHGHQPHGQVGVTAGAQAGAVDRTDNFVEAEAEADQRQAGADPGHQGALLGRPIALLGQFVSDIHGIELEITQRKPMWQVLVSTPWAMRAAGR